MKLFISFFLVSATCVSSFGIPPVSSSVSAFGTSTVLRSSVECVPADVATAYESSISKMREKDQASKTLSKEDLKVVYEDEHILVIDKPSGILSVPTKEVTASLSQAVFDAYGCESGKMDSMVVHRLGMDTSGLMVFARTAQAVSGLNTAFRTRKVTRKYEALVCGSVECDEGEFNMPLMRDFVRPPYMRVSTDDLQRALIGVEGLPAEISKKILENPKESVTKYSVVAREQLGGNPVTRLSLTSVSGRTHQLNVHCAASGHPIVGDKVYGLGGDALPNGGLDEVTMDSSAPNRASLDVQESIAQAASDKSMCIHASELSFKHPITREEMKFESATPF